MAWLFDCRNTPIWQAKTTALYINSNGSLASANLVNRVGQFIQSHQVGSAIHKDQLQNADSLSITRSVRIVAAGGGTNDEFGRFDLREFVGYPGGQAF